MDIPTNSGPDAGRSIDFAILNAAGHCSAAVCVAASIGILVESGFTRFFLAVVAPASGIYALIALAWVRRWRQSHWPSRAASQETHTLVVRDSSASPPKLGAAQRWARSKHLEPTSMTETSPRRHTVAFIMSTNWAGSTALGLVIGSRHDAAFLGEPAMILRRDAQGGWRHQEFCMTCGSGSAAVCPLWGPSLIAQTRTDPDRFYDLAAERLPGARFFVDSSKNMDWVEGAVSRRHVDVKVIHISKAVYRYAGSVLNRRRGRQPIEAIGWHWANENREIREWCAAWNLDYLHVRYADFARDVAGTLQRIGKFLDFQPDPRQEEFWAYPHHYIKGNPGTATHFDQARIEHLKGHNRELYRQHHRMIFLDDTWKELLTQDDLNVLCSLREVRQEMEILHHEFPRYSPPSFARRIRGRLIAGALRVSHRIGHSAHR